MAIALSILSASEHRRGSYLIHCTACRDGNNLGAYDTAEAAHTAARKHRCIFPQVHVNTHGDKTMSVSVTLNGARMDFTPSEATALMSNLAQALAQVERTIHAAGTAQTLAYLNEERPQVSP